MVKQAQNICSLVKDCVIDMQEIVQVLNSEGKGRLSCLRGTFCLLSHYYIFEFNTSQEHLAFRRRGGVGEGGLKVILAGCAFVT